MPNGNVGGTSGSQRKRGVRASRTKLTHALDPAETARRLRADVVVDGEIKRVGRLSAVRVYLFRNGVRHQVWAESVPTVALDDTLGDLAADSARAIRQATRTANRHVPWGACRQ